MDQSREGDIRRSLKILNNDRQLMLALLNSPAAMGLLLWLRGQYLCAIQVPLVVAVFCAHWIECSSDGITDDSSAAQP